MFLVLLLTGFLLPHSFQEPAGDCGAGHDEGPEAHCRPKPPYACNYTIKPLNHLYGAMISDIELSKVDAPCGRKLTEDLYMYRVLLFRDQSLDWPEQITLTAQFGEPFQELYSANRKRHDKIPDARLGFFSNDINHGLTGIGVEGWHVDGNTVETPHKLTILHCVNASKVGPTLFVPLKEVVDLLSSEERKLLETVYYVSAANASIVHPLLYKNPYRNDDSAFVALGSLSGQYQQRDGEGNIRIMSVDETQFIKDILEAKIMGSNLIYAHQYQPGDVFVWANHAVAHIAGPGTQLPSEVAGLRLVHRTSVKGVGPLKKKTNIKYECANVDPFPSGYCLFSLYNSVYYPRTGDFDTHDGARNRCRNVNKNSDLAVIWNDNWNNIAKRLISQVGAPHWVNASNPTGYDVYWGDVKAEYSNWDPESGQPNDCLGPETCVIFGPFSRWFDFTCEPKMYPGADRGPVMTWEDGTRKEFNVYPLCGVQAKYTD